ncbi:hypothetical protein TH468_14100 [Thalassospira sp. MCCC 1A03138]|nr:hypothetical protein TH468_14100 [Thalassospira sp. MCCC 1A03138]
MSVGAANILRGNLLTTIALCRDRKKNLRQSANCEPISAIQLRGKFGLAMAYKENNEPQKADRGYLAVRLSIKVTDLAAFRRRKYQ